MSSLPKMPLFSLLLSFLFVNFSIAGYTLEDDYTPSKFFDMFTFFTDADPTNGFVDYVDRSTAQNSGLIGTTSSNVYIGTDHSNVTPGGRPSIRLTSNKAYNAGSLIILDLQHMPGGVCGTWPAFWMVGPQWPSGGEVDIIEGVNEQSKNSMALHTDPGCTINNNGNFTGSISTYNCDVAASGQSTNAGCSIGSHDTQSYGTGLNNAGGGVYATEWTNASISIWFFSRASIPWDITAGTPNPSTWGSPTAQFQGGCDIPEFFQDNQLVFDLTYCGDWAGSVWSSDPSCSAKASTCVEYVQNNPSAFTDQYWQIGSLRTYQYHASAPYVTTSVLPSSTYSAITLSAAISTYSSATSSYVASSSASSEKASTSEKASSTSTSTSTSTTSHEHESSSTTSFRGRWSSTGVVKAATQETTMATSSSQSQSTSSSSSSSSSSPSATDAATLSQQTSTVLQDSPSGLLGNTAPIASTAALSAPLPSANSLISSAVPTSQAEMLAKAAAMADEWSTTQPSGWQDRINEFEDSMQAASSQAAAVSAKLKQNQRRHLLTHKRKFGGNH